MELIHLIYSSASTTSNLTEEALNIILSESRENNKANNISGILLYQDGSFFQVLEGGRTQIDDLYRKISADKRHSNVTKIIEEEIEERSFGEWTMGYPNISRSELEEIPGLNDFFQKGNSFSQLEEGRTRTLLAAFKEGKWRKSI